MNRGTLFAGFLLSFTLLSTRGMGEYVAPEYLLNTISSACSVVAIEDLDDWNDAYDAVAQYADNLALASIQGTHSDLTAKAHSRYQLNVSGNTDVLVTYTLMAELFAVDQAYVESEAYVSIWAYDQWGYRVSNYWGYPGVIMSDSIWLDAWPTDSQPRYESVTKLDQEVVVPFSSAYNYVLDLQVFTHGQDWWQQVWNGPIEEFPDAYYSAAAYVDPTFIPLTDGVTITVSQLPGSETIYVDEDPSGTLEIPNPRIPEPSTLTLVVFGLLGLLAWTWRTKRQSPI
jgi:hypothetical protein